MSYWICIIIGTLLIVSIADVQNFLFKDIVGIKYYLLHLLSSFLILSMYIQISKSLFVRTGEYSIYDNNLIINVKNKKYTYSINEIDEIYCIKKSYLGNSFIIFGIKHKGNYLKIFSKMSSNKIEVENTELYLLYSSLKETRLFLENKDLLWLTSTNK